MFKWKTIRKLELEGFFPLISRATQDASLVCLIIHECWALLDFIPNQNFT